MKASATRSAVRARISQEVSLSLEAERKGRCHDRMAYDRHVMKRIVEAERKAYDE